MTLRYRGPLLVLAAVYLLFIIFVIATSSGLPARLATHSDAAGNPNGWMPRSAHISLILAMGFLLPFFVSAICFLAGRYGSGGAINIPHRDFWLAPERKDSTVASMVRHSLWFSTACALFFVSVHYSVVFENRQTPPHLPVWLILGFAGAFLVFVIGWTVRLLIYFRRPANG